MMVSAELLALTTFACQLKLSTDLDHNEPPNAERPRNYTFHSRFCESFFVLVATDFTHTVVCLYGTAFTKDIPYHAFLVVNELLYWMYACVMNLYFKEGLMWVHFDTSSWICCESIATVPVYSFEIFTTKIQVMVRMPLMHDNTTLFCPILWL